MGNPRLTADLDDDAASELIDWGVSLARRVVLETAELPAARAESARDERLNATRKMMRAVNNWVASRDRGDPATHAENVAKIAEKFSQARGEAYDPPNPTRQTAFLEQQLDDSPTDTIVRLREFLEKPDPNP